MWKRILFIYFQSPGISKMVLRVFPASKVLTHHTYYTHIVLIWFEWPQVRQQKTNRDFQKHYIKKSIYIEETVF